MKYALRVAITVGTLQCAAASAALAATVYVNKGGTDTGSCPNSAPCLTIGYAYSQAVLTGAAATIVFTGNGNWQENVNLNVAGVSVEMTSSGDVRANINPVGGTAAITVALAASDTVRMEKVRLGGQAGGGATNGILFQTGRALQLDSMEIRGFSGNGINFTPTASSRLFVLDSLISNNGSSGTAAGIYITPNSGVTANITVDGTRIYSNSFGIIADGTANGSVRGDVRDSIVSGNAHNGITVSTAGTGASALLVENTTVVGNDFGLAASGTNAGMLVSQSSIVFNNTGLFKAGGAPLFSYKNNNVNGNATTDGTFTGSLSQQ